MIKRIKDASAPALLSEGYEILAQRGKDYDQEGGERSMTHIVTLFNCLTGHQLTVADGYKFMQLLKMVRIQKAPHKRDSYVDLANYAALEGETALEMYGDK